MMKTIALAAVAAIALSTAPGHAADMTMPVKAPPPVAVSPWDLAFGAGLGTDYIFRGITQSNHRPSVNAYFEPRYNFNSNLQAYAGVAGESISFPNRAAAEIDFYGGIRPTFGPVAFDFGYWYYYYPGGECFGPTSTCVAGALPNGNTVKSDFSFWEVYAKALWTVNDQWALGGNFYATPNILNTGADGQYLSGTVKYTAPASAAIGRLGWYVSGEFGRQFLGTTDAFYGNALFPNGIPLDSYNTWNVGLGLTYKVFTLDLRYSDTDLSEASCNAFTGDHTAGFNPSAVTAINGGNASKWCGATFMAKLSFDMTLDALK